MKVHIIGLTGGIGGLLARLLRDRGDTVEGLVRREDQLAPLRANGIDATVGDLSSMSVAELAAAIGDADTIVFTAGSNGGSRADTQAIDGDGVAKATAAASLAGAQRLVLVSVLPESWRERSLSADVEFYFTVKKSAEIALTRSALDWIILRPSLLVDEPGTGTVSLGPAEFHGQIAREDVARSLAEIIHEPRLRRQILELTSGPTPVADAVRANIRFG